MEGGRDGGESELESEGWEGERERGASEGGEREWATMPNE